MDRALELAFSPSETAFKISPFAPSPRKPKNSERKHSKGEDPYDCRHLAVHWMWLPRVAIDMTPQRIGRTMLPSPHRIGRFLTHLATLSFIMHLMRLCRPQMNTPCAGSRFLQDTTLITSRAR
jgi:hypothetical protein